MHGNTNPKFTLKELLFNVYFFTKIIIYKEIFNKFKYSTYVETTGNVMNNTSNVSLGDVTLLLLM
jgi:hypothetical protein